MTQNPVLILTGENYIYRIGNFILIKPIEYEMIVSTK